MTNRERAEKIAQPCELSMSDKEQLEERIERALDEKDAGWKQLQALGQTHIDAYIKGQREMREMAAKEVYGDENAPLYESQGKISERIRALPIEGEIPEENKRMGCNHPGDICEA